MLYYISSISIKLLVSNNLIVVVIDAIIQSTSYIEACSVAFGGKKKVKGFVLPTFGYNSFHFIN